MHHPDTHTHAHIHTHQKQWAVKRCPYPPQKASTNQIRPDQNMPFKVRAGVGGGSWGSRADTLTLGAISMTRKRGELRVGGGQGGIKKECKSTTSTGSGNPGPLRAYSAPDPCLTTLLLHIQPLHPRYCNSPTTSHTSLAWTVGPGLPLRKPRPHLWVVFIIPCMSYLILWVIGCRTISNVKYTTCIGYFTFCSLLIEDQLKRKKSYMCTQAHFSTYIDAPPGICIINSTHPFEFSMIFFSVIGIQHSVSYMSHINHQKNHS